MTRSIVFSVTLILSTITVLGQTQVIIDGDKLNLRDSLQGKVVLLSSIERGSLNQDALWITYNRKPGVDPWGKDIEMLVENFTNYWTESGVRILGALVTYDNCMCFKTKTMGSTDMYLIHFKLSVGDWEKMKLHYPDMLPDVRRID
ncbi:MAG: hypothetical protein QM762_18140 [Chryseolinea sp.]